MSHYNIVMFIGHAAGGLSTQGGGGSNSLCLPEDPQWKTYRGGDPYHGSIAGVEYDVYSGNNVFSEVNNGGNSLHHKPAPCAFCYVQGRSTVAMIPARTQCPDGWSMEYTGYLMSEYTGSLRNSHRSSYICWDEAPEVAVGGITQHQAMIYPVDVICGSLPCSVYVTGRQLTCVVCSK